MFVGRTNQKSVVGWRCSAPCPGLWKKNQKEKGKRAWLAFLLAGQFDQDVSCEALAKLFVFFVLLGVCLNVLGKDGTH